MNPLEGLLAKFQTLLNSSRDTKKTILDNLHKHLGIEFQEKDIDIRDGILYLYSHPSIKNEVFMRKGEILADLKTLLDKKSPRDIR
ncbi:hypothetical protein KW782_01840 [Candidatus Parcubacteria bacterium]|nr:hypothetical protein [Candidatus Parcubacteria bacterium]